MKRSELNVGDELYYAQPRDWADMRIGVRVVVVSTKPHKSATGWSRATPFKETVTGSGVLVDIFRPGLSPRRSCVQLGHLRGPFAEVEADVRRQREERFAADKAADLLRDKRRSVAVEACARAARAGYADALPYDTRFDFKIVLSPETLNSLLDVAESNGCAGRTVEIEHGWASFDGLPIVVRLKSDLRRLLRDVPDSRAYSRQVGPWRPMDESAGPSSED